MSADKSFCSMLSQHVSSIVAQSLSDHVKERARWAVLDFFSSLLSGYAFGGFTAQVQSLFRKCKGHAQASVVGSRIMTSTYWAAFANGAIAHTVELDDGHRFGTSHPAVAVIPAALATAEVQRSTGQAFLEAVIAGYEAMLRIATAINPGHWERGFHTTGTCGGIGAAAAAARVMNFGEEKTAHAISMGALQGAGLQQMLHGAPEIKPLQAGRAAAAGILSAELAAMGACAPLEVFEGRMGFFQAMTDRVDTDALQSCIGKRYEIERTYFKYYPACRHIHAPLDAARKLLDSRSLPTDAIRDVIVHTYRVAAEEVSHPVWPVDASEAMFSLPYALAVMLSTGSFTLEQLHGASSWGDDVRTLAERVRVEVDRDIDSQYPRQRGVRLSIVTDDGAHHTIGLELADGEPETMENPGRLIDKYLASARGVLGDRETKALLGLVHSIDKQESVEQLAAIVRSVRHPR